MAYGAGDSSDEVVLIGDYYALELNFMVENQSVEDNTSEIGFILKFVNNGGRIDASYAGRWYVDANGEGQRMGYENVNSPRSEERIFASDTFIVHHNSDGTASCTIDFGWDMGGVRLGGKTYGQVAGSVYLQLNTIPRASGLTVYNGTLGSPQTIVANVKASGFAHSLTWSCGGRYGEIANKSPVSSWSFTPPLTLAETSSTANQLNMTFTLTTYSGGTQVGSPVSKSVVMSVPSSVLPSCDVTIADATQYYEELGGSYLQNQSKLVINVTAAGSYGSSVTSYRVVVDGVTYSSASVTTDVLRASGNQSVIVTVTDSRGRSATKEKLIYVQPYDAPRITHLSVRRCNADGSDNISGQYASATYSYSVSSISVASPYLRYKRTQDTNYLYIELPAGQSANRESVVFAADDGSAYNVELVISDEFGSATRKTLLSTAYAIIHFPASGKGITFGGVAIDDGFNCNMEAYFSNGITYTMQENDDGDCNDFKKSGTYYIGVHAINRPKGSIGFLTVKSSPDLSIVHQQYVTADGETFTRLFKNSEWGNWADTVSSPYPVGAIYISANSTDPGDIWVGTTWQRIQDRFLLAAGAAYSAGTTGGESSVSLSVNNIPPHDHYSAYDNEHGPMVYIDKWGYNSGWSYVVDDSYGSREIVKTSSTGGGQAHNNMPPYLAVYVWKRIS